MDQPRCPPTPFSNQSQHRRLLVQVDCFRLAGKIEVGRGIPTSVGDLGPQVVRLRIACQSAAGESGRDDARSACNGTFVCPPVSK